MKRLPLAALLIISLFVVSYFAGGQVGASVACSSSGGCRVLAASSIISLICGLIIFLALSFLPRKSIVEGDVGAGFLRKVGALFFDMFLVSSGFSALLALPMLYAESLYTGTFQWGFARTFVRASDWPLVLFAVFGSFLIIAFVRVQAIKKSVPSFGQYIMGYQIIAGEQKPTTSFALHRIAWAVLYLAIWPAYLIYKKVKKLESDLWDVRANTKSVKFNYS